MKLRYLIFCLGMAFLASALRSQEFNATLTQALAKSGRPTMAITPVDDLANSRKLTLPT